MVSTNVASKQMLLSLCWFLVSLLTCQPSSAFRMTETSNRASIYRADYKPLQATSTRSSAGTSSTTSPQQQEQQQAQGLLDILLARYQNNLNSNRKVSIIIKESNNDSIDGIIRDYIEALSQAQVSFDPDESFGNGSLYAVLHQQGPKKPLWEKIGIFGSNTNVKGQQYTYQADTQTFDLINYAEILGKGFYIQVQGTAKKSPRKKEANNDGDDDTTTTKNATTEPNAPFWEGISSFFSQSSTPTQLQPSMSTSSFLQCPCEIVATVQGGGLYFRDNKIWDLDFIQGTGVVRVLYADANLRVLESPYSNNGGWEDQGLIVVQVRKDVLEQ